MIAILREGVVKNFIISFGVCRNIYFVLLVLSLVLYVDILVSFLGLTGTFSLNFCFKSFQIFFLNCNNKLSYSNEKFIGKTRFLSLRIMIILLLHFKGLSYFTLLNSYSCMFLDILGYGHNLFIFFIGVISIKILRLWFYEPVTFVNVNFNATSKQVKSWTLLVGSMYIKFQVFSICRYNSLCLSIVYGTLYLLVKIKLKKK